MKVRDLMTKEPSCCSPETNLAAAAGTMWRSDCGVLPVTENGKLAGIITDRDICIAVGTRNRPASEIAVKDVVDRKAETCLADDDVENAMSVMRRAGVRRLPVVSEQGKLEGIVALNDIVLASDAKRKDVNYDQVMNTLKALSQHRKLVARAPEEPRVFQVAIG